MRAHVEPPRWLFTVRRDCAGMTGRRTSPLWLIVLIACHVLPPGDIPAAPPVVYQDITGTSGIKATHNLGYELTGQAWGDVDNDGWLDLYITDADGANQLYCNNGDGTFTLHAYSDSLALAQIASGGAVFADYNNDGWADLYVLNDGPNVLYQNVGGTAFIDVTAIAGVGDDGLGTTAAWGDYDGDGYLDLYVSNFHCAQCALGSQDVLYHNNGDGTFTDLRALLPGLGSRPVEDTFVASFLDYDNDGDLDIYAVYDHRIGNDLWRNDGPGCGSWCFTNVSVSAGADIEVNGMGLAVADYDCDGDLDLYFTDLTQVAVLLQNQTSQGSPTFLDVTVPAGLFFDAVGWGTAFFDYDNDGWLDLYTVTSNSQPQQANLLYHNEGNGTFANATEISGSSNTGNSRGLAYADFDNDGWVDFIIGNEGEAYYLYRNQALVGAGNHWLDLQLVGSADVNRDAIGARAYAYTNDGRTQMQEIKCGSSLGAGNQLRLHFGLGAATIDSVCVVWPNGQRECLSDVDPDQLVTWTYNTPSSVSGGTSPRLIRLFQNAPNPFGPATTIEFELPRPGTVLLQIFDVQGRLVRTLVDEARSGGRHRVVWKGMDNQDGRVPSAVYLYRITAGSESATGKMLLLR